MSQFNILDPNLALDRKYFIEASAGCGKTFSIENAYVRLIMESKHNLNVENILILTFTKEATSELRARIRASLENARNLLVHEEQESFEYIKKSRDLPEVDFKKVVRNLQDALSNFDSSQIFTIHKFCYLQLKQFLFEAKLDLSQDIEKNQVTVKTYETIVKDYLSFSYDPDIISPAQLRLLLAFYKNDFNFLIKACVGLLSKEAMIEKPQPFSSFYKLCTEEIKELKLQHGLNDSVVYETCLELAFFYKGTVNREKKVNKQLNDAFEDFSMLFSDSCTLSKIEKCMLSFSSIYKTFQDINLKKSALKQERDGAVWTKLNTLKKKLFPLFQQASLKENLISLVAYECQKLVQSFFNKNKI